MKNDALDAEVLILIFKKLPLRKLARIRLVCPKWRNIIDDNKTFWRTLILSNVTLKVAQSSVRH